MIICNSHKIIFSRPLKVGSTSVEHMIIKSGSLTNKDYHLGLVENAFAEGFCDVCLPDFYPKCKDHNIKMNLLHATPDQLYAKKLLVDKMLDYTFIGILRNPIERFLSAWVMEVIGGFYDGESYPKFIEMLEKKDLPYIFRKTSPLDHISFNGSLVKNYKLLRINHLAQDLSLLFDNIKPIHLKVSKKPSWMNKCYTKFIPKKLLIDLKYLLEKEINFYESFAGEIIL